MRNTNPPPRRCYLSMHWTTPDAQVNAHYAFAHDVMDSLVKAGHSEADAKAIVEQLWSSGRAEGYEDAMYDCNDHD